jgi:hypothetical protein
MTLLSYRLEVDEVFSKVSPNAVNQQYVFRGMVCYYGLHYVSIFRDVSAHTPRFLLFDDANIRVLGQWVDVISEVRKARYQPVLLVYELETLEEVKHVHVVGLQQHGRLSYFNN